METTEDFETHMREVLHGAEEQAAGFTAAQVIVKGRSRKRARTATASGVALVAAGAVAIVPSALAGGNSRHAQGGVVSAGGVAPAVAVATPPTSAARVVVPPTSPASSPATPKTPKTPHARVVPTGTLQIGDGYSLVLTRDSMALAGHGGQSGPNYTDNGNQAPDSIDIQGDGNAVAGLYIGEGQAATGTVTVGGKAYPLQVVTLAGHPGWSVGYAILPTAPTLSVPMSISVSDAAGHQLASFTQKIH